MKRPIRSVLRPSYSERRLQSAFPPPHPVPQYIQLLYTHTRTHTNDRSKLDVVAAAATFNIFIRPCSSNSFVHIVKPGDPRYFHLFPNPDTTSIYIYIFCFSISFFLFMSADFGTGKPMSRKPQLLLLLSDSILLYKSFFSGNTLTYIGVPEVGNETFLLFLLLSLLF